MWPMAEIVIRDLRKEFGDFVAVRSSTFTVRDGEFFMILGPSGCGKTTTLRMIAGLELPSSGEILIDGQAVAQLPASRRDIAFVFQMYALYPHMNVRRNIAYPLRSQGMARRQIQDKVAEASDILGIAHLLDKPVSSLSGGDRQRVALARAIVRNPKCFLMDEPLGALDAEFRARMADELRALHNRMAATTVYVTHDQLEAMQMGDRIVIMNDGNIEQCGVPQTIYDKPASMFVADFVGSPPMNFLTARVRLEAGATMVALGDHQLDIPALHESFLGDAAYGIRPEHVRLSDAAGYRGEIAACEYLGTTQIITLSTQYGTLKARVPASQPARVGDRVGLAFDSRCVSMFDVATGRALRSELNCEVVPSG